MRTSRGSDELQLGRQLDLPADGVAAVREGQLPVEAPVATVDRRAQLERGPLAAERIPGRRSIATHRCDGSADTADDEIARDERAAVVAKLDLGRAEHQRRVLVRLEEV